MRAFHSDLRDESDSVRMRLDGSRAGKAENRTVEGQTEPPLCNYVVLCMYGHTYSKSMDQPGKVANLARGQLNRETEYFPVRVRA